MSVKKNGLSLFCCCVFLPCLCTSMTVCGCINESTNDRMNDRMLRANGQLIVSMLHVQHFWKLGESQQLVSICLHSVSVIFESVCERDHKKTLIKKQV